MITIGSRPLSWERSRGTPKGLSFVSSQQTYYNSAKQSFSPQPNALSSMQRLLEVALLFPSDPMVKDCKPVALDCCRGAFLPEVN